MRNRQRKTTCLLCQSVAESRRLTEQLKPDSAGSESPVGNPDAQIYGIAWPANRLTYGQMRTLRQISKDVRVPITQLLKDAVDVYLAVLQREMQAMMVAEPLKQLELFESDTTGDEGTESDQLAVAEGADSESSDENSPTG